MTPGNPHAMRDLVAALDAIRELLEQHGDRYVSDRVQAMSERAASGDPDVLYTAYVESRGGGMGSLSDRYLHPDNGDRIEGHQVDPVNRRLSALVAQVKVASVTAAQALGIRLP